MDKVFYMGKNYQQVSEQIEQLEQNNDYEGLIELTFDYPELKKTWQSLAKLSKDKSKIELFNQVSKILQ